MNTCIHTNSNIVGGFAHLLCSFKSNSCVLARLFNMSETRTSQPISKNHEILPGLSASSPEHTVSVMHLQTVFHPDGLPDHSHNHLQGVHFEDMHILYNGVKLNFKEDSQCESHISLISITSGNVHYHTSTNFTRLSQLFYSSGIAKKRLYSLSIVFAVL